MIAALLPKLILVLSLPLIAVSKEKPCFPPLLPVPVSPSLPSGLYLNHYYFLPAPLVCSDNTSITIYGANISIIKIVVSTLSPSLVPQYCHYLHHHWCYLHHHCWLHFLFFLGLVHKSMRTSTALLGMSKSGAECPVSKIET